MKERSVCTSGRNSVHHTCEIVEFESPISIRHPAR